MKKILLIIPCLYLAVASAFSQSYDLQKLLSQKQLEIFGRGTVALTDASHKGVSSDGIAWLKDVTFSSGTIEIELKGRDVLQKSFIGIAFHGVDTSAYDAVYFRPFNFNSTDPVRKIHAVQYVTHPEFPWYKLREEQNGKYEKAVSPAPGAEDWFHARIVVKGDEINVFVNKSATPSLTVKKLNTRTNGKIGICSFGEIPGDFANLVIRK
jgi:hypothetical protein